MGLLAVQRVRYSYSPSISLPVSSVIMEVATRIRTAQTRM